MMFKRLLVPLDRSPLAEQAIGQATAIARATSAELDIVLVHQPFPFAGFNDAPWSDELRSDEQHYLETVSAEVASGSGVRVTHAILKGETTEMICQRADETHADLIVLTTHGRTGVSRFWLGSIANGVLRCSKAPVLMLRPVESDTQRNAAHRLFKRILIPVDGSSLSSEVLSAALDVGKCDNAHVSLLRVVQPPMLISPEAGMPYAVVPALADESTTKRLTEEVTEDLTVLARRLQKESGLTVDAHVVVEDRVAATILSFALAFDVDLIAMSTHGRGASRLLLGSVADKVLRGSHVPLLLYRPLHIQNRLTTEPSAVETVPAGVPG